MTKRFHPGRDAGRWWFAAAVMLNGLVLFGFWSAWSGVAYAQMAGPGWFADRAAPVRPQAAAPAVATAAIAEATSVVETASELAELAQGLQHDPRQIYAYVRHHIDYVPYTGALKGALLTYLDGAGNDFDQAALLVALLRESGIEARYVQGLMSIPGEPLANWLGVDPEAELIGQVLGSGGIPVETLSANGDAEISRVWVEALIDGTAYRLDPAFKPYAETAGIDLTAALRYTRSALLAAATAGAMASREAVRRVNEANLAGALTNYSTNLANTLRRQYPNAEVAQILGGRRIVVQPIDSLPTALAFPTRRTAVWETVPAADVHTLRVEHAGIDHTLALPDLGGRRLTLTYAGGRPQLRLDGALLSAGNTTATGQAYDLTLTVDHPYLTEDGDTYADQRATYQVKSGATYALIYGFGGTRDRLLRQRQDVLEEFLAAGEPEAGEAVRGETLHLMGLTWLQETALAEQLLGALADTVVLTHHRVGLMAQEDGYYIDVKNALSSVISRHGVEADAKAHFYAAGLIGSAFEHGMLEQLMGSDKPAASTMKLFGIANASGQPLYYADAGNFATLKTQLQDYSPATLNNLQAQIEAGHSLILPHSGRLVLEQWQGGAYLSRREQDTPLGPIFSLQLAIGGGYFGGYAGVPGAVEPDSVNTTTRINTPDLSRDAATVTPTSVEPVDLASGAYLYERTDLALAGPLALAFTRRYNSSLHRQDRGLGFGWTHDYDGYVRRHSHGAPGLGTRQPVDAAAMIAALVAMLDLLKHRDDLTGWVVGSLIAQWAVARLIDNAVTVHRGTQTLTYLRLADGRYAAPPGVSARLSETGDGRFTLVERFGTALEFDLHDRLVGLRDADGNRVDLVYANARLSRVESRFGNALAFGYNGNRLSAVTDSAGRRVGYAYDGQGNLITATDPAGKPWGYRYDAAHRLSRLIDPLNVTLTQNGYDVLGRVRTQTVPRPGGSATYAFFYGGAHSIEQDPDGGQTAYFFDDKGRTVAVQDALDQRQSWVYDGQNQPIRQTDPRQNTTRWVYNADHNPIELIDPLGRRTRLTYDSAHRLSSVTTALGHTTRFRYDPEHHLVSVQDAMGHIVRYGYGTDGQRRIMIDGRGTVTTLGYDGRGRPRSARIGSQPAVTYTYDSAGRLSALTDPVGARTRFTYDPRGLLQSRTDPVGRATTFNYDAAGRPTLVTDRNNTSVRLSYTPSGRLARIGYPEGAVTFDYDRRDNRIRMQDRLGTTRYRYDAANRLISHTDPHGFTVGYGYDAAGNLTRLTYPGNKTVRYAYDALNRLESVATWLGQTARYRYDADGRLIELVHFNGAITRYGYDPAARLTSVVHRRSAVGEVLTSFSFTLDANGNRVQEVRSDSPPALPPQVVTYTYNTPRHRLLQAGALRFGYDPEGRLATRAGVGYTFDAAHRLTGIGAATRFFYDGTGQRLKVVRNGSTTRYVYDAAGNLLAEANGSTITRYYVHGLGMLGLMQNGQVYSYHHDAVGSTVALTDAAATVVNRYAYTPFGRCLEHTEALPQPFQYVGRFGVMAEPEGLYYMRARYYDPQTGRFVSEDPIGFAGGDLNLYAYALNNPLRFVDPSGNIPLIALVPIIVNTAIGAFSGAAGAAAQGGDTSAILRGAIFGGAAGAFSGGASTLLRLRSIGQTVVNGVSGGTSNVFGQFVTSGSVNPRDINIPSVIGSTIGGVGLGGPTTLLILGLNGVRPTFGAYVGAGINGVPIDMTATSIGNALGTK